MFFERLNADEVKAWLGGNRLTSFCMLIDKSLGPEQKSYLYVSYTKSGRDKVVNCRLYDFDTILSDSSAWRKFLFLKFGEEYKNAFEAAVAAYTQRLLAELRVE